MSFSCVLGGSLCDGCMACQEEKKEYDRYDEEYDEDDEAYWED